MTGPVRAASTVVLLRDGAAGLEVFLVRRHDAIAFMGGAHVFPGGRVEASDRDAQWQALVDGVGVARAAMPRDEPLAALGFYVAAVRETFEEVGVLLAREPDGEPVRAAFATSAELMAQRRAVSTGTARLRDLFQARGWRLAADALAYFAHWVTPAIETRRFDARFFLAAIPAGQEPVHDASETTAGVWVRPADAIARCVDGSIALPPPTWTTLRWLEPLADTASALEWARRKAVPRIEPGFIQQGETRIVTLPGDVTMPAVDGFEARETRFLLAGGRWTPIA